MPPRRAHDELTKSDVRKLLEASAAASDEDHLFLLLLARTGRRIGELLELTVRDIDYDGRFITTSIEKRRKAQRRKMFVDDGTLEQLRAYIAEHHLANSDKVFPRCMRVYQRLPMRYAAKAGIDKYFTCHSFRHYFITYLIKYGWSYGSCMSVTDNIYIHGV